MVLARLVRIPGGTFLMGSDAGYHDELPLHEVEISPFELDERVVTNREYRLFLQENPEWRKDRITPDRANSDYLNLWIDSACPDELLDHSVINVSQHAAAAFAHWAGKRLPTESEWEYAAGGPDRLLWSVSDRFNPTHHVFGLDGGQPRGAVPAGCPPNAFGLYDMCGLVWEWTQDRYDPEFYARSPRVDPVNADPAAAWGVLRGGAGYFDDPFFLRIHIRGRNDPVACNEDYGFRCARNLPGGSR